MGSIKRRLSVQLLRVIAVANPAVTSFADQGEAAWKDDPAPPFGPGRPKFRPAAFALQQTASCEVSL